MMLIHFPSALFPASLIADFTAIIFNDNIFFIFSFYAAAAGVIFGFAALIFGVIDLLKLPSASRVFNVALLHGGLNFLWLTVFSILAGMDIKYYPDIEHSTLNLTIKTFVVSGLIFSNYLGGELVLKYGIGKKE